MRTCWSLDSLLVGGLLLVGPALPQTPDGGSLEELLQRARAAREQTRAEMTGTVQAILAELETLPPGRRERDAARRRARLRDLGPEAAPLLVPHLDPGPDPGEGEIFRARQVTRVLRELASPAVTDELLRATGTGSIEGRVNALRVLERCPEPERAVPVVRDLFRVATGRLRTAALVALARLGGPGAEAVLTKALQDPEPEVVDLALRSLAEVDSPAVTAEVVEMCRSDAGAEHVLAIGDYFTARPERLEEEEHLVALVELLERPTSPRDDVVAVLGELTDLDLDLHSRERKALEPLAEHPQGKVRRAALVLLARAGDRGALRNLMHPLNDAIRRDGDDPRHYVERGDVWYRVGEHSNAIRDYKAAIDLMRRPLRDDSPFIGLARCYARMGKFKDAKEYLSVGPLSISRLQELAEDPAFAEMLETRYRTAFYLPDEDE